MEKEKYKIDRFHEKVYEYNEKTSRFFLILTFYLVNAVRADSDSAIIKKIEDWKTKKENE